MRCVVQGASGHLENRLVPELLSAGHEVWVLPCTPGQGDLPMLLGTGQAVH